MVGGQVTHVFQGDGLCLVCRLSNAAIKMGYVCGGRDHKYIISTIPGIVYVSTVLVYQYEVHTLYSIFIPGTDTCFLVPPPNVLITVLSFVA